jgi:hypothetical protein
MKYEKFKSEAKKICLAKGMQYNETVEGNIVLTDDRGGWIALRDDNGDIRIVLDPEGEKDLSPVMWVLEHQD